VSDLLQENEKQDLYYYKNDCNTRHLLGLKITSNLFRKKTGQGGGAYPFRTWICTVRMAIDHIVSGMEQNKIQEPK